MLLQIFLMPLFLLAFVVAVIIWDYTNKKRRNLVLTKSNIKGPEPKPVIGNALYFKGLNTENMIDFAKNNRDIFGRVHRFWVLHQLSVVVADAKYLELILSSSQLISKSYLYTFLEAWLGTGLLLSTGKKWHTRRKIITPTFHFKILEQFIEIFDQQSGVMVKKLYGQADGKTPLNIFPVICLTALDIIAETAMGVKVHAQEHPELEYVRALTQLASIMGERFINPIQRTEWGFRLTQPKQYRELKRCITIMHNFTNKVIQDRREKLQKSISESESISKIDANNNINDDVGSKKRMALLDVLLQSTVNGQPLSNEDIREEVDTFMFEGHDTTTSGIAFCLYLISRHPDVQKKCIDEIHEVIGDDKYRPVYYKDLQELKYLECVIKETLRLFPPVPVVGRQVTEDTVLDDITLPAKTGVNIPFFVIMRDPAYFPDPDAFKPDRYNSEDGAKINPFAYTPFSAGPRNCIGQKFAMFEMKSTVSKILRHFELLPLGEPIRPVINLVFRSLTGVNVGLKPRV